MAITPVRTVHCIKGKWTQVTWASTLVLATPLTYHYRVSPGARVHWRWFSVGIPPFWGGEFTGDAYITLPPLAAYTSLEFYPDDVSVDVVIGIY